MNKKIISIIMFALLFAFMSSTKATSALTISVNDNLINSENKASVYWNTNLEANCGIDYSLNSDLSGGIGTNGSIIQVGLPTNDGKFHYVVNLNNLQPNTDYYYRVNCNLSNDNTLYQSDIKKLPKYNTPVTQNLIISVNENSITSGNKASVYWNTNLEANCGIDYSLNSDLSGGIGTNGSIIQYATDTNDGKYHYVVNLNNLQQNTDYYYRVNCDLNSKTTMSEIKKLKAPTVITNPSSINIYEVRSAGETKNSTSIYFKTNGNYDCKIKYSDSENYDKSSSGKLVQSGTATNGGDFVYNNKLENLLVNTKYYYKVVCVDSSGNTKESAGYNFTTLADYADVVISDVNLTNLAGDAVKITWKTNINTSYNFIMLWDEKLTSGKSYNEKTKYGTEHEIVLTGLQKNTKYKYYAFARLYDGSSIGTESKYFDFTTTSSSDYQSNANSDEKSEIITDKDNIANQGKAILLSNDMLQPILTELKQLRDQVREQAAELKYLKSFASEMKELNANMQTAIKAFIAYGVDDNTKKLGEGERAAVISSYEAAYDKLPQTEAELTDVIKIANGRWPSVTSAEAEKKAKEQFQKIYKRIADMNDPKDNAAITVMAYGLRQKAENRNLNSEKNGINIFKGLYGNVPQTTEEWNIMQAITYSGASRGVDTDGDLLIDSREQELGTNPKNKDTDGDGYIDGIEVANGFDPLKK